MHEEEKEDVKSSQDKLEVVGKAMVEVVQEEASQGVWQSCPTDCVEEWQCIPEDDVVVDEVLEEQAKVIEQSDLISHEVVEEEASQAAVDEDWHGESGMECMPCHLKDPQKRSEVSAKTPDYLDVYAKGDTIQHQGKSMLFFAGRYYKQCIYHPDQYRVLYSNYGEVGKWFAKVDSIGDLRNNLERKSQVMSIIGDNIGKLKDIVIDGASYPWKEEDIYLWCIKSLAAKRKYTKRKAHQSTSSSSGSTAINNDLHDKDVGMQHGESNDLDKDDSPNKMVENAHDDNALAKLTDMDTIVVIENKMEKEAPANEDVEVYIPEIPWQNNDEENDAYEEYQRFISDGSFGVALEEKKSYESSHGVDHNHVENKKMKDNTSSEFCDSNVDLLSRKSVRKRKAMSKLQELLKKKEKASKVSNNKKKKELSSGSREESIIDESSVLEKKARELCSFQGHEDEEPVLKAGRYRDKVSVCVIGGMKRMSRQ
ncbi:hypothetical protein GOP47_0001770 [Adiantum capillus-veneris]|uniref:Uncharacterized protein n=1 Tax=Adiantum capillus-veneris TaxID=13818 RepID=A0A9D4ZQF8_ADICA|nr:hypothetical protein GOP47_0001770 [Adiantum capillus-veneris]